MSLTHVCMWTKHGWKPITDSEAAYNHPGGTVSAQSGLFMCGLCGQNVIFTGGQKHKRHFKHSAAEKDKNCDDRSKYSDSESYSFRASERELPLKLKILPPQNFEFQLGLPPVPEKYSNHKIIITSTDNKRYVYSFERISEDSVTYLPVGNIPCEKYTVTITPYNSILSSFWPQITTGIFSGGTLFDGLTGKKLPYDADVIAGHEYYLLTQSPIYKTYAKLICETSAPHWYVYEICADFDEESARFFLNYHYRLAEKPADIIPVWPVYVRKPYLLYHCADKVSFFIRGDANPAVYPEANIETFDGKIFTVNCNERQQIIAAGRIKILRYVYLWKNTLNYHGDIPQATVTNSTGEILPSGEQTRLPKNRIIRIKASFDGYALKLKDELTVERYGISAGEITEIDGIKFGQSVEVYQGLDMVWQAHYVRAKSESDDDELYDTLKKCRDDYTVIPHSIGALSVRMNDYPKAKSFLCECIRNGRISRRAYNILIHTFAK